MIEPSKIEELRQKFPSAELHRLRVAGEELVVRAPTSAAWERFTAKRGDPATRFAACRQLIVDCAGVPSGQELAEMLERRPGLIDSVSAKLAEICGAAQEAEAEKL
jgi:hypothetical protein